MSSIQPGPPHGSTAILDPTVVSRSLPRLPGSTLTPTQFYRSYQQPGEPVVLTAAVTSPQPWTLTYLCQQLGDRPFLIRQFGRDHLGQDKRQWPAIGSSVASIPMTFADYAACLMDGTAQAQDLYLAKCALNATPLGTAPELQAIVHQLGLTTPVTPWNLWVGPSGHTTCLHYDPFDGLLVQLQGQRRLVLFPPSQLPNLYPFPVGAYLYRGSRLRAGYSQLYPDAPDYEAFPRFRQAQAHRYEVILNPGEAIFIPAGWWHEISTQGAEMVCAVNRFWAVRPVGRSLTSWSKWRVHLASVLALPTGLRQVGQAVRSGQVGTQFWQQFWQRL